MSTCLHRRIYWGTFLTGKTLRQPRAHLLRLSFLLPFPYFSPKANSTEVTLKNPSPSILRQENTLLKMHTARQEVGAEFR